MEDSFRVRVDKTFGSLAASSSTTSSSLSSLWSLTDEEIERREWNRQRGSPDHDDDEPKPYPSNLDGFFANQQPISSSINEPSVFPKELDSDLQDLDDDDDDEDDDEIDEKQRRGSLSRQSVKPEDLDDEEWEIRSSIGLDCTLDYEAEEDPYDKVAIGREEAGDRLYMGGITDYKIAINSCNELPNTFRDVTRDSRANHMAAKVRLKEDAEAAGNFDPLRVSYNTVAPAVDSQNSTSEDAVKVKSILKRRENQMESKSEKRVRFDPECKDYCEKESEGMANLAMETSSSLFPQDSSVVPDHIRNPSKYTHYTFDSSSDIDEESNRKAYMDFLNLMKGPSITESKDDVSIDLPKSVTFIPKKQLGESSRKNQNPFKKNQDDICKEYVHKKGFPTIIAAVDAEESDICAMEEDEPEKVGDNSGSLRRTGRQYRTKASSDLDG